MSADGDLDRARISELHAGEVARFRRARPRSLAMLSRARAHMPNGTPMAWMASEYDQPVYVSHGQGAGFTDVDGFTYLDFNASDMSMFCGHANPAIVAAVQVLVNLACRPDDVLVVGAGRRGALGRLAFSKVGRYCLAHAQCPVVAVPPPVLAREFRHGRLARAFWRRSLTPEQVLRGQERPAT